MGRLFPTSKHRASSDDPNEYHDQGDHEEDVNESSHRVRGYQPEDPQHDEADDTLDDELENLHAAAAEALDVAAGAGATRLARRCSAAAIVSNNFTLSLSSFSLIASLVSPNFS